VGSRGSGIECRGYSYAPMWFYYFASVFQQESKLHREDSMLDSSVSLPYRQTGYQLMISTGRCLDTALPSSSDRILG
jgi:hypothetical protein